MNKRKDVLAKVTGKAVYANDIELPGMVYAKVVRSTVPSGIIRSIDSEEASKMPGVIRIITAKDIPGIPSLPKERPVLCPERVRYIGDGVALVVAERLSDAEDAAEKVKVEYEELPALLDATKALEPDAPKVHETGNRIACYVTKRGMCRRRLMRLPM